MKENEIILGDAYKLIKELPDKSVDLIVTDPPYLYCSGGGGGCFGARNWSVRKEISSMSKGFDYSILDDFERVEIEERWRKVALDRLNGITANGQTSIFTDFGMLEENK